MSKKHLLFSTVTEAMKPHLPKKIEATKTWGFWMWNDGGTEIYHYHKKAKTTVSNTKHQQDWRSLENYRCHKCGRNLPNKAFKKIKDLQILIEIAKYQGNL